MYFCRTVNYTLSDLKSADAHLLQFLRPLVNYSVSAEWIKEFAAFLTERQKVFLTKFKRAKEVSINYHFSKNYPSKTDNRCILHVGSIYVHFDMIEAEMTSFDVHENNAFYNSINNSISNSVKP